MNPEILEVDSIAPGDLYKEALCSKRNIFEKAS